MVCASDDPNHGTSIIQKQGRRTKEQEHQKNGRLRAPTPQNTKKETEIPEESLGDLAVATNVWTGMQGTRLTTPRSSLVCERNRAIEARLASKKAVTMEHL